jgi:TonB family protein
MGKIVKFCSSCDEGFAEKFGFCPICGQTLQAFEMNPVEAPTSISRELDSAPVATEMVEPEVVRAAPVQEMPVSAEPVQEIPVMAEPVLEVPLQTTPVPVYAAPVEEVPFYEEPGYEEPVAQQPLEEKVVPVASAAATIPVFHSKAVDVDRKPISFEEEHNGYASEGGYYVTVIEEKNSGRRNGLLLGSLGLVTVVLMSSLVYSLFAKQIDVASINDDIFNALLLDLEPMTVEQEQQKKIDRKNAGGGGGGGREEPDPASRGQLPKMMKQPDIAPDVRAERLTSPTLTQRAGVEGPSVPQKITNERYGIDTSRFEGFSNGPGTGGGIGTGTGRGVGSGRGSGIGSGSGGGLGSGTGGGIGPGDGEGSGLPPPPERKAGVTQALKILSKPKASYTDAARVGNIQGTVLLRVTFLASGQVGPISTIKGLPSGLTEQAIAAAKRVVFEPAKVDGVPRTVTKQMEFSFSIY